MSALETARGEEQASHKVSLTKFGLSLPITCHNSKNIREHSYMTSDVLGVFLTYLPTLIRYFTT